MKNATTKPETHREAPKTVAGLLLSALDMEEELAHSVYQDYLDGSRWPAHLDEDVFQEIQGHLTRLLEDTQRHKNVLTHLKVKLEADNGER